MPVVTSCNGVKEWVLDLVEATDLLKAGTVSCGGIDGLADRKAMRPAQTPPSVHEKPRGRKFSSASAAFLQIALRGASDFLYAWVRIAGADMVQDPADGLTVFESEFTQRQDITASPYG